MSDSCCLWWNRRNPGSTICFLEDRLSISALRAIFRKKAFPLLVISSSIHHSLILRSPSVHCSYICTMKNFCSLHKAYLLLTCSKSLRKLRVGVKVVTRVFSEVVSMQVERIQLYRMKFFCKNLQPAMIRIQFLEIHCFNAIAGCI